MSVEIEIGLVIIQTDADVTVGYEVYIHTANTDGRN